MTSAELLAVLTECHREKLALRQRYAAVARHVSHYDFNNTYQYIIAREDVHLQWVEHALLDLGATPDQIAEPALASPGKKDAFLSLVKEDAREVEAFVARWRPRVAGMTQARHQTMLNVVLGEMMEEKRFFDQMMAGREDLLGRHTVTGTGNGVLGTRWLGD